MGVQRDDVVHRLVRRGEELLDVARGLADAVLVLDQREADVITLYFGLNGEHSMTLEEIGEKFNLTRERVRQIKEKAIRRLRHTSRSKALKPYLG